MTKENGLWNLQFQWEFNGFGDRWDYPAMSLEILNSRAKDSRAPLSMTEEEVVVLWDAMLDSIRIRHTTKDSTQNPAASAAPAKPRLALGTRVKSGVRCPQAGVWECGHKDNLCGTRHTYREDQFLTEALLDAKRGFIGWCMRRPAETVADTTWTLVGYLDEGGASGDLQPKDVIKPDLES